MKKIATVIIAGAILAVTVVLLVKIYPRLAPAQVTQAATTEEPSTAEGHEWLSIYFQGKKVGYTSTKVGQTKEGHRFESVMKMSMVVANELKEIQMVAQVNTDADYRMKSYYMNMTTYGHAVVTSGEITGKKVRIVLNTQGLTRTQEIELDSAPYFHDAIDVLIKKRKLKTGDSLTLPFYDIATQTPSTVKIKILGKDRLVIENRQCDALKVSINVLGMESFIWLDQNGRFLKESSPLGIEMIREDRAKALAAVNPDELVDILTFVSVKLDTLIPNPQQVTYMKLEVTGLDTVDLDLRGDFQKIIATKPLVIECSSPDLATLSGTFTPGAAEMDFLKPSMYIQCEAGEIVSAARQIARDEKNKKVLVEKLTHWVYDNLKKRPTVSMPSAIDVLKTMEGDCNEHSVLFAALARALGIPTKIYVGLVNLGSAYYYHAWCSVYLGDWVPVDPTFDEFPANAGHLKLKEGELAEQTKVLKVVGRVGIRVLEYR